MLNFDGKKHPDFEKEKLKRQAVPASPLYFCLVAETLDLIVGLGICKTVSRKKNALAVGFNF